MDKKTFDPLPHSIHKISITVLNVNGKIIILLDRSIENISHDLRVGKNIFKKSPENT